MNGDDAELSGVDESAVVAAFLSELLEDREHGRVLPLEHYQRRFPGFEAAIAAEHARLAQAELEPRAGDAGSEPAGTERYRIEGELGRGGMGRVYSVWDSTLRRRLAMKVLRETAVAGATAAPLLARFVEEAQVTAQLDHPGVVPVHDLGIDDTGGSFFTMSLVRGRSLEQVFSLVAARAEGWTQVKAISVLLKVCEAVAFAHSKGVLHRDLKPANVMVGSFGETYVMDWGLARVQAAGESAEGKAPVEPGVRSARRDVGESDPGSSLLTQDGDVLGTPAYMAPEQARGDVARLGPRADVYALGAMLYHLLSGSPPYSRERPHGSWRDRLDAVLAGPPLPLAVVAKAAPAELVSICAKAMAREPEARYGDVLQLADDLQAFLENRVVRAHRSGAFVELRKWVQRNRLAASAAAVALLALLAGAVVSWTYKARADADARRAEAGYEAALGAVDKLLAGVAEVTLAAVPGAEVVRRELLVEAQRLYGEFLVQHGTRPELRSRVARVHDSLAVIHSGLGEFDASEKERRAAIAAYEAILQQHPDDAAVAHRLVASRRALGMMASNRGRRADAEAVFQQTLEETRQALQRWAGDVRLSAVEARLEHDLAFLAWRRGARKEAVTRARRAVDACESCVQRSEQGADELVHLANCCNTLGSFLVESDLLVPADAALQRAVAASEQVLAKEPRRVDARISLANAHVTFDYVHTARRDVAARKEAVHKALELYLELAAEFPRVPDYHSKAATALNNRALISQDEGALEAALSDLQDAIRQQRIALGTVPDHAEYRMRLRNHIVNEMWTLYRLGRHAGIPERCRALIENAPQQAETLRDAAAFHWMAAGLAADDPMLTEAEQGRRRDELVQQGADCLRTAVEKGLRTTRRLDGRELEAVRQHPVVVAALQEVARAAAAAAESRPAESGDSRR